MDAKTVEWIIVGPLLVGLLVLGWWATAESHRRLDDPDDDRTVHLDRLREILNLAPFGSYQVTIFRQSGNVHAERIVTGTAQDALAVATSTLRRAGIHAVNVGANSDEELRVARLYHDHRGRNEGRKVGKARIILLERSLPPPTSPDFDDDDRSREPAASSSSAEPTDAKAAADAEPVINLRFVGLTCDCGEHFELPIDQLERERACAACGADATLTASQIAQVHAVAAEAREEALARWRAGETNLTIEHRGKLTEATPGLTAATVHREAAREAIESLGLLRPQALATVEELLRHEPAQHPRATATAYRKDGEQLSREEKKAAGIRANAFMSTRAFEEIADSGRKEPLSAHETTLLRAIFTVFRYERVTTPMPDSAAENFVGYRYRANSADCPFCSTMDGRVVGADELAILPAATCTCATANYGVEQHFDWVKHVD